MARRTFAQIQEAVAVNVGRHALWVEGPANEILAACQREVTEAWQWSYRKRTTFLQTIVPVDTGTVSIAEGSSTVTGVGTAFTEAMVGRAINLGNAPQYLFITAVDSPTSLEVGDYSLTPFPWGGPDVTGQTYSIWPMIYPLPDDLDTILLPTKDWPLHQKTTELFDRLDPLRTSRGDPDYFAYATQKQVDGTETRGIEFWPIASSVLTLRLPYVRRALDPVAASDIPLCPTELVEKLGTARAARYLRMKTGDQRYTAEATDAMAEFASLIRECVQADVDRFGVPETISEGELQIGSDEWARRDWSF
jgi:hypothetical protein